MFAIDYRAYAELVLQILVFTGKLLRLLWHLINRTTMEKFDEAT